MNALRFIAAIALLGLFISAAKSEIISASFTTVEAPYQVNLSDSTAYALWGTGTNGSLIANLAGGQEGLITTTIDAFSNGSPTTGLGSAGSPLWDYSVLGTQTYGGITFVTGVNPDVAFNVWLTPGAEQTNYKVWMQATGGPGSVAVLDYNTEEYTEVAIIPADKYGYLSVSAAGGAVLVELRSGLNFQSSVVLGGVTADVIAVSEPIAPFKCLLTGLCLTPMVNRKFRRRIFESKNKSPSGSSE